MKIAFIFITAALILSGCTDGTDSNSKVSVINDQEAEEGTAKEDPEQEIPEEKIYPELEPLSEGLKKQLEEDYWELFLGNNPGILETVFPGHEYLLRKYIRYYYGTYDGSIAVMFNGQAVTTARKYYIDDIMFFYRDSHTIKIWDKGVFYELQEAYDLGLLDREDLESIAFYLNKDKEVFYGLELLSDEIEMQIRIDYCIHIHKLLQSPNFNVDISKNYVFIDGYFGTYNNCIAVIFNDGAWQMGRMDNIAGVIFRYGDSNTIKIWNEGDFYELQEAYDLELLDKEDLENIAYYWYNRRK